MFFGDIKRILPALLLFCCANVAGYRTYYYPRTPLTLINQLNTYDSVILVFHTPSFRYFSRVEVNGFGIKAGVVTRLHIKCSIHYKAGVDTLLVNSISEKRVTQSNIKNEITNLSFSNIANLNNDSLNSRYCSVAIDDGYCQRVLVIKNRESFNVSAYEPEFYQESCPTKDRGIFIETKKKVEAVFKK